MSLITELARKEARISDMSKGYPLDTHQRGCGYWQRFVTAVSVLTDQQADELQKVEKELRLREKELAELKQKRTFENVRHVVTGIPELPDYSREAIVKAANGR